MKVFIIKKTNFRMGDIDSEQTFRFQKEADRDDYLDYLVKEELKNDDKAIMEHEKNEIAIYPSNDKWAYSFEKTTEEVDIIKSINSDMSFNY